jgi:hypothetical protein
MLGGGLFREFGQFAQSLLQIRRIPVGVDRDVLLYQKRVAIGLSGGRFD